MYDICLTVSAWCIIGLLGVLFISSARREISRRALLIYYMFYCIQNGSPIDTR